MIRAAAVAMALTALASPGCLHSPELSGIRHDIESQLPEASFDTEVELSVGPVTLALARVVSSLFPGAREARTWLKGVSRVQIGVYDAHVTGTEDLRMPQRLQALVDDGWETAVRMRDRDQAVWVLYRADEDKIKEMFVMVLNDDELVLVRAKGKLDRLIAAALEEAHGRPGFRRELDG
jgi:hypothetical protein